MLKAGHYTDLLRQVNELKRQLHLVGKVQTTTLVVDQIKSKYLSSSSSSSSP